MDQSEWDFAVADKCPDCEEELPLKVCRSAAGCFIGKECPNDGPYSRLSQYFSPEVAEYFLILWRLWEKEGHDLREAPGARPVGYVPGEITVQEWQ